MSMPSIADVKAAAERLCCWSNYPFKNGVVSDREADISKVNDFANAIIDAPGVSAYRLEETKQIIDLYDDQTDDVKALVVANILIDERLPELIAEVLRLRMELETRK